MGRKNISLNESAYRRLASMKREDESFSDLVERLAGEVTPKYSDRTGILSDRTIGAIETVSEKRRAVDETGLGKTVERFEEDGK